MPDVTIVYWRDIPAQVIVGKGRRGTKRPLAERFEQAIDRAAMKSGMAGTDDYLVKPFAMEELVMRVKALAKRRSAQNKQLAVSGLVMDLSGKSVSYNGTVLHCSPTGFKLLEQLMRASPNPIDRDELVELVWGEESPDSNSLKVHMHKLRKALSSASVPMEINFKTQVGFSLSPVQES